jgi:IMP dehydrogenase
MDTLSFDDVLISPRLSNIESRKTISLKTPLTKKISLNLPLISSPMDTITEDKMAINMALNGALGIIHRYNTIEYQVNEIKKVKRHLSFIIENPYTILETETVNDLYRYIKKCNIHSFLVTNNNNELCVIITNRDLNAHLMTDNSNETLIKDIMTTSENLHTVSNPITRQEAIEIMNKYKIEKLPVVESNKIIGLINYKTLISYEMNKDKYSLDKNGKLLVGGAIGIVDDYLERAKALVEAGCDLLGVDVANGFNTTVKQVIQKLKTLYPNVDIMSGNVCSPEGFEFLCKAGADCIRVGIGNGSICSTRLVHVSYALQHLRDLIQ